MFVFMRLVMQLNIYADCRIMDTAVAVIGFILVYKSKSRCSNIMPNLHRLTRLDKTASSRRLGVGCVN